jgi:hypothetical protein
MVKMIRDNTGRFAERPFYEARDLDNECERLIRDLLLKRRGTIDYPVATDDLTVLRTLTLTPTCPRTAPMSKGSQSSSLAGDPRSRSRSESPPTNGARTDSAPRSPMSSGT